MIGKAGEVVLPRRAVPQPHPDIHPGGDCGACSLGGALGIGVSQVYERFDSTGITNFGEMARCMRCAGAFGFADRVIDAPAEWPMERYLRAFGSPAKNESLNWFTHVRMAIDAGYYGVTEIDYGGNGGPETNHWVVLCGSRFKGVVSGEIITGEVLVSCSVQGEKWYEVRDFLTRMGGYAAIFIRPAGESE